MTNKQKRRIAQEVYDLNLVHDNPESSEKEKKRVEKRLVSITRQIMCLPRGMETLGEIDSIVQQIIKNKNKGED